MDPIPELLRALRFAAIKHRDQRRKGPEASPYINHPLEVAELIARIGGVRDVVVLQAAILHDTVEDTETEPAELETEFGSGVRRTVEELTDDKKLPKDVRKRLQIEHAIRLSEGAKLIKLADKICNVRDVISAPPPNWSYERRVAYVDWSRSVVDGCRGVNKPLEQEFDAVAAQAYELLGSAPADDD